MMRFQFWRKIEDVQRTPTKGEPSRSSSTNRLDEGPKPNTRGDSARSNNPSSWQDDALRTPVRGDSEGECGSNKRHWKPKLREDNPEDSCIWKSGKPCEEYLIARRTFASLEHSDACHAVQHLRIEENLDTADDKLIISTLDDAFGYYEDEEKYIVFDKIFGDSCPNHE